MAVRILRLPAPRRTERGALEREFLPAALEIVETPAAPVGRRILLTICAFWTLAIAWACWGELDIVASAPGRIVASGRNKTIQPFDRGVVRAVYVKEGQAVRAGDLLVEMDSTSSIAERERITADLQAARLDAARSDALAAGRAEAFQAPEGARPEDVALQHRLLADTLDAYGAKVASLEHQILQKSNERASIDAICAKLSAVLPLVRERVEVRKYLVDREVGSRLNWLAERQELVNTEHELAIQKSRKAETEAALAAALEMLRQERVDFRRTALAELHRARQKTAVLEQELVKAEQRAALEALRAPVDGTVEQVRVTTLGGVVSSAEPLMSIVPSGSQVEIEATLSNKDVGFVKAGQAVEIKVDAFPFTRYGLVSGRVLDVSSDALDFSRTSADQLRVAHTTSQSEGQALLFKTRIALDSTYLNANGHRAELTPGLAVTAEILTGSRRLIDFLISPLLRYRQESLRER